MVLLGILWGYYSALSCTDRSQCCTWFELQHLLIYCNNLPDLFEAVGGRSWKTNTATDQGLTVCALGVALELWAQVRDRRKLEKHDAEGAGVISE